jgi:outer membrane protein OmpA-like peptidoglycan-associated protein
MLQSNINFKKLSLLLIVTVVTNIAVQAQLTQRVRPEWWFGVSGAANFNTYRGTTQVINNNLTVPTAFHKGSGVKPYGSLLVEYRKGNVFGGMLNVAYDNRGGKFNEVIAPCNCPANLSTNISYVTIEPSLRIAPFSSSFYVFAGPTISINIAKSFDYTQLNQTDVRGDWSDIRKTVLSAQFGAGIDIPVSNKMRETQMTVSPFVSFQTDLGQSQRTVETWSAYSLRTGVALKMGTVKKSARGLAKTPKGIHDTIYNTLYDTIYLNKADDNNGKNNGVSFSVRAPKTVAYARQVKETLPLRNSVFFNMGSAEIPNRYKQLTIAQAKAFKEEILQANQPSNLYYGRTDRQLTVYYNILNILGDRLRNNPNSSILLSGASDQNPVEGKRMAENIKSYLVNIFGINGKRVSTEGRDKPVIPSEQPGATKSLDLLREGDRRVDITSTSSELLMQTGGTVTTFLKPVQISNTLNDPLDSYVLFNVDGAEEQLSSWGVNLTNEKGNVKYYGPFASEQASVPGKTILGMATQGNYKVEMLGTTKKGKSVKKYSTLSLVKVDETKQEGLRYSILFDFDKIDAVTAYENFLTEKVAPLIPNNSTVIIHGHTDIIGEEKYNKILSNERASIVENVLKNALSKLGKKEVQFQTTGFGEDESLSPFENKLPEERFYNRTVIIDIIPSK